MDTHSPGHLPDSAEGQAHAPHAEEHYHPTWKTYRWVALILFLITVAEVWAYYIPAFVASRAFVPALLIMSAAKFIIVVMFYMHLKYDHRLFRVLFTGPLLIAGLTLISLLFLLRALRDVRLAQRSHPRPERRISLQRAHGAAPGADPADAAASHCGCAGRDAAARAPQPPGRGGCAVHHEARCVFRDLQRHH